MHTGMAQLTTHRRTPGRAGAAVQRLPLPIHQRNIRTFVHCSGAEHGHHLAASPVIRDPIGYVRAIFITHIITPHPRQHDRKNAMPDDILGVELLQFLDRHPPLIEITQTQV